MARGEDVEHLGQPRDEGQADPEGIEAADSACAREHERQPRERRRERDHPESVERLAEAHRADDRDEGRVRVEDQQGERDADPREGQEEAEVERCARGDRETLDRPLTPGDRPDRRERLPSRRHPARRDHHDQ